MRDRKVLHPLNFTTHHLKSAQTLVRTEIPSRNLREKEVSGLQKGPAERGHVKKRQKASKSVKNIFDTFRHFSRGAKNVKNRQKVSKSFSTLFDNFRAAPFFRPLLQSAEKVRIEKIPKKLGKSQKGQKKVIGMDEPRSGNPPVWNPPVYSPFPECTLVNRHTNRNVSVWDESQREIVPRLGTFKTDFFRVARLQNEVGTKDFFWGTNFLTKNAPNFSPKILSLYFVGQKKSRKIPAKFPAKFPSPKSKKIHRRASAGAPGEDFCKPTGRDSEYWGLTRVSEVHGKWQEAAGISIRPLTPTTPHFVERQGALSATPGLAKGGSGTHQNGAAKEPFQPPQG